MGMPTDREGTITGEDVRAAGGFGSARVMRTSGGRWAIAVVAALLLVAGRAGAQTFDDAVDAYDAGEYQAAAGIWQALAQGGHVLSQYNLGLMYENGTGVPVRYDLAFFWYRMASINGNIDAMYNLGGLYYRGQGVAQSEEQARHWWEEAANAGEPNAAYNLGVVMLQTSRTEDDLREAMIRLKQASDAGHPEAASLLNDLSREVKLPDSLFFSAAPIVPAIDDLLRPNQGAPATKAPPPVVRGETNDDGGWSGGTASYRATTSGSTSYGSDPAEALDAGRAWIQFQPAKNYTVKVYPWYEAKVALWYLKKWGFGGPGAIYVNRGEYYVLLGSFSSKGVARSFLSRLLSHVPELQEKEQRVVRFSDVKKEARFGG